MKSDKRIVEDIVPGRRTIRNISMNASMDEESIPREKARVKQKKETEEEYMNDAIKVPIHAKKIRKDDLEEEMGGDIPPKRTGGNRRFSGILATFIVIFICIAVIAIALSLFYSKAVVSITPKIAPIEVNGTFTAKKTAGISEIPYEIITKKEKASMTVAATTGALVETKAKGTAYLYNEQSSAQTIIAGTRLSNSKDLVYRTSSTVSIPAGKTSGGKFIPGSVSVSILASEAGADYNMSLSDLSGDLKVVAYKGGDKYEKVYGMIKSDITGGFSGNKITISPEVRSQTVEELKNKLKASLSASLKSSIDKDSVLYDDAIVLSYSDSDVSKGDNMAEVVVDATAYGAVFKSDKLLKSIGTKELEKFPVSSYETIGLEDLDFSIVNSKDFSPIKETALIFSLKGPLKLVGTFSHDSLKNDLKSIGLEESDAVFGKYSSIGSAHALITPFWMRSFPNDSEKIIIDIKSE